MAKAIELHQALHGYGDGHQLLSSSLGLTRDQQWQLLVMSDLSGPSFRTGFDSYLTGYPLLTGGFYCLARTWFAPELPRPGCVWTHTILISETDVAQIHDFRSILSHFRRPLSDQDIQSYKEPIHHTFSISQRYDCDQDVGGVLLYLLYGSPSRRVILTSESSRPYEETVIALFGQQWPRLRRNFRFCTGALAIRDVDFDLAVAPPDALRQDTDTQKTTTVASNDASAVAEQSGEDWVRVALDDLLKANPQTALRRFLWKFGPDYSEGRSVFRPLCEIHLALSLSSESVEQVLSATSHFFPEADSSKRLKAEFFGVGGTFGQIPHRGESLVLRALVTHPAAGSIPAETAAIEQRAAALVSSDDKSAIEIATVASSIGGIRAQQYLDGFATGVGASPELLHRLSSSLTFSLLKRRPSLLTSPELWRGSTDHQLAIAAYVSSLHDLREYGRKITEAVLTANAWPSLASVLAQFGCEAVSAILEWIDAIPQTALSLPEPVFEALAEQRHVVTEVIQQKQIGARALRVVSAFLDPRADRVRALGTKVWVGVVGSETHLASVKAELRSRAFVLSIGLSLAGEGDVQLVREGFSAVYDAARDSCLDDEIWSFVEPYLPWYLVIWDRCARLIRGVVRLFLDRQWPASEFIDTFQTAEQFHRALEEADMTRRGSRYIRGICDLISAGSLTVDHLRAEALKRYCHSSGDEDSPVNG
jgi:hypothetical protein